MLTRFVIRVLLGCVAFVLAACEQDPGGTPGADVVGDPGAGGGDDVEPGGDTGDGQTVPLTPANLFFVERSVRTSYSYVDMWFAPPPELGATRYTLQVSDDDRATWHAFQHAGADLTTDVFDDVTQATNFSIDIERDRWLRLLISGGPHDGETSNEVWVTRCEADAYVSHWHLDESMTNTGVMGPHVGYGLVASFTLTRYSDSADLSSTLTYQWYRVNPADLEDTQAIEGATSLSYTTVAADKGHRLLIRAEGNGTDFDGFCQIRSTWIVQ